MTVHGELQSGITRDGAVDFEVIEFFPVDEEVENRLAPRDLRQMLEMGIRGAKDEIMLNDEGGNPQIVRWYGHTLFPKLEVELRIVMRCLFIRQEDGGAWAVQESPEIDGIG
ncbi:MAG TPA: hypothetical protein VMN36_02685 [Verrucomicrobiales bacterium]|nr:hypothetical protein [Verrucomicrobiales bacterium]